MRSPTFRRRTGFTFVEVLIVMIILGILAGVSAGRIGDIMRRQRLNRASMAVAADLRAAYARVARSRTPATITITGQQLTIVDRRSGNSVVRRELGIKSPYQLESVAMTPTPVTIFPNGLLSSSAVFTLQSGPDLARVRMTQGGAVRVEGR